MVFTIGFISLFSGILCYDYFINNFFILIRNILNKFKYQYTFLNILII
jgi:hypothetical protein